MLEELEVLSEELDVLSEELDESVASADAGLVRWRLPPNWAKVVGMSVIRAMEEKVKRCMIKSASSSREWTFGSQNQRGRSQEMVGQAI